MTIAELTALMAKAHDLEAETRKYDLNDDALDAILEARDKAQEAVNDAVTAILGEPPEWSNRYGFHEALNDCIDAASE